MTEEKILQDVAIEITAQYGYTTYPEDIKEYYEKGMTPKNLLDKVVALWFKGKGPESQNNRDAKTNPAGSRSTTLRDIPHR